MAFFTPLVFRTELPRAALLDFIARTPAEQFVFVVPPGPWLYGLFLTEDVAEFLCNEFAVARFEVIPREELARLARTEPVKIWGNRELLDL